MAGRHAADEYAAARHHLGHHREVARDDAPFWAYLERFTLRRYAYDFFVAEKQRWVIGFVCGVLFVVGGVTRMFVHPGWRSLGVVMVGAAIALLCFVFPLLLDLIFAYLGAFVHWFRRPHGRRRRR